MSMPSSDAQPNDNNTINSVTLDQSSLYPTTPHKYSMHDITYVSESCDISSNDDYTLEIKCPMDDRRIQGQILNGTIGILFFWLLIL